MLGRQKSCDILSLFTPAEMIYEQPQPARSCILRVKQTNLPSSVPGVAALVLQGSRALLPASPTPTGKHDHPSSTRNQLFWLHIHFTRQNNMFPPPAQPLGLCSARLPLSAVRVSLHREWVIEPPTCKPLRGLVPASIINHGSPPPHHWKSSLPSDRLSAAGG